MPCSGTATATESWTATALPPTPVWAPRATPSWLKLVRDGTAVTGYYSTDDTTWTQVGTATLPGITPTQDVGVFTTAHQADTIGEADYTNFTLGYDTPSLPRQSSRPGPDQP